MSNLDLSPIITSAKFTLNAETPETESEQKARLDRETTAHDHDLKRSHWSWVVAISMITLVMISILFMFVHSYWTEKWDQFKLLLGIIASFVSSYLGYVVGKKTK